MVLTLATPVAQTPHCRLFSAWFCPYAQRVWMTLNLLEIPYERIEALTLVKDPENPETPSSSIAETEGYRKHPRLLELNPKGLVPTLELLDEGMKEKNKRECGSGETRSDGAAVTESLDGMDFLGRCAPGTFTDPGLFDLAKRANEKVCSPFYRCLVPQEDSVRRGGWEDLQRGLREFTETHAQPEEVRRKTREGFLVPDIVDLAVFPWAARLYVLEEYRGFVLEGSWVEDFRRWKAMVERNPAVAVTLADRDLLLASYERYARGTAKSLVGEAVRQGKEAHDV